LSSIAAGAFLLTFAGKIWAVWEPDLMKAVAEWANPLKAWEGRGDARRYGLWLMAGPEKPRNFAIVGPLGSGKTTLLKHLALALSAGKVPLKKTPILLFLREHAAAIGANPDVKLAEFAEASLKNLLSPAGWFAGKLARGKCVVMLDGIDEVAGPSLRKKTVQWVEKQVETPRGRGRTSRWRARRGIRC
jgi:predicted NACHT family NTPase